jgi:hypothetical protein
MHTVFTHGGKAGEKPSSFPCTAPKKQKQAPNIFEFSPF